MKTTEKDDLLRWCEQNISWIQELMSEEIFPRSCGKDTIKFYKSIKEILNCNINTEEIDKIREEINRNLLISTESLADIIIKKLDNKKLNSETPWDVVTFLKMDLEHDYMRIKMFRKLKIYLEGLR